MAVSGGVYIYVMHVMYSASAAAAAFNYVMHEYPRLAWSEPPGTEATLADELAAVQAEAASLGKEKLALERELAATWETESNARAEHGALRRAARVAWAADKVEVIVFFL